jgi:hypothetical protein
LYVESLSFCTHYGVVRSLLTEGMTDTQQQQQQQQQLPATKHGWGLQLLADMEPHLLHDPHCKAWALVEQVNNDQAALRAAHRREMLGHVFAGVTTAIAYFVGAPHGWYASLVSCVFVFVTMCYGKSVIWFLERRLVGNMHVAKQWTSLHVATVDLLNDVARDPMSMDYEHEYLPRLKKLREQKRKLDGDSCSSFCSVEATQAAIARVAMMAIRGEDWPHATQQLFLTSFGVNHPFYRTQTTPAE